jgi:hypothetical protein
MGHRRSHYFVNQDSSLIGIDLRDLLLLGLSLLGLLGSVLFVSSLSYIRLSETKNEEDKVNMGETGDIRSRAREQSRLEQKRKIPQLEQIQKRGKRL